MVSRGKTAFVKPALELNLGSLISPRLSFVGGMTEMLVLAVAGGDETADQRAAVDVTIPPFPPRADRTSYLVDNCNSSGAANCATLLERGWADGKLVEFTSVC